MTLRASEASSSVLSALVSKARSGRVHSSYTRTVNLLCEDMTWLSLHPPAVPIHPFCVRVVAKRLGREETPFLGVAPSEAVRVSRSVIDLGNGRIKIHLDDAEARDCRLNPAMRFPEPAMRRTLDELDAMIGTLPLRSAFLKAVTGVDACQSDPDGIRSVMHARVVAAVDCMESAWRLQAIEPVLDAVKQVVGLGIGLTPSGDDFLIGFLGASYFFANRDGFRRYVFEAIRPLIHRTSLPSFFMLKAALSGLYPGPLSDMFRALDGGSAGDIRQATLGLNGMGATSGEDMLAGVLSWLHISLACGAGDAAHRC